MLHSWASGRRGEPAAAPSAPPSSIDGRTAALAQRRQRAWRCARAALAAGDWTDAANWEEQVILSEHQLGLLHVGGA
jgi:hypothetical protein